MKTLLFTLITISILSGCTPFNVSEYNDSNIAEYKKCKESDMDVDFNMNGKIVCTIPNK